jgi:hypothetical protein
MPVVPGLTGAIPSPLQAIDDVVSVYTTRATESKAIMNAQSEALNNRIGQVASILNATPVNPRITLTLEGTAANKNTNVVPFAPRAPGSPGRIPLVSAKNQAAPSINATLVFDVVMGFNGFAQNISYTFSPRQTTHQTAGGFYVDEFGLAPGSLAIDVLVATTNDLQSQLSQFTAILETAKKANPLSPSFAQVLRYVNAFDGRAFLLTQTRLDVRMQNDRPNQLLISLSADILTDYSASQQPGGASQVATTINGSQQTQIYQSIADYVSV